MTATPSAAGTATDTEIAAVEEQLRLLFVRVRAVWKEAAAAIHPELQPVGYKILVTVARRGPMQPGALADHLVIDKSVVSRQMKHLESLGLAQVRVDPADRRARILEATPAAVETVSQRGSRMQQQLYAQLRTWPGHDVDELARLLGRLTSEVVAPAADSPQAPADALG